MRRAEIRQLCWIAVMIVVLVGAIRVQQGFTVCELIHHPSFLWHKMWTERGY